MPANRLKSIFLFHRCSAAVTVMAISSGSAWYEANTAVIGLLLVYCLKDAVFASYHALPELIAITVTAALQRWKRNMLLSLFAGTALYMLLVQTCFV